MNNGMRHGPIMDVVLFPEFSYHVCALLPAIDLHYEQIYKLFQLSTYIFPHISKYSFEKDEPEIYYVTERQ